MLAHAAMLCLRQRLTPDDALHKPRHGTPTVRIAAAEPQRNDSVVQQDLDLLLPRVRAHEPFNVETGAEAKVGERRCSGVQ